VQAGKFPENRKFNSEFFNFSSRSAGGRRAGVPTYSLGRAGSVRPGERRELPERPSPDFAGVDRRTAAAPSGRAGRTPALRSGPLRRGQNASPLPRTAWMAGIGTACRPLAVMTGSRAEEDGTVLKTGRIEEQP